MISEGLVIYSLFPLWDKVWDYLKAYYLFPLDHNSHKNCCDRNVFTET